MSNELVTTNQPPSTLSLIEGVLRNPALTPEMVSVVERLVALKEREDIKNAERDFNVSFVALKQEIPVIVATSVIPNRGKYERYEDIMRVVGPLLLKHGFSESYSQSADDKRITVNCHLSHVSGCSRTTPFSVRLGGRADSDTQADCKASTTAKRNALLMALGIVIRQDIYQSDEADSSIEGGFITREQAADLRLLCEETGSDMKKFLEFADAKSFEEIMDSRFADLVQKLNSKRTKK